MPGRTARRRLRDQVLAALDSPALRRALAAPHDDDGADLLTRLRTDEDAFAALEVAHFADGELSGAGYLGARQEAAHAHRSTRRALARRDRTGVLHDLPASAATLRTGWEGSDIEWRRRLLAALVEHVKVQPAVKGRSFVYSDRVEIVWRY